MITEKRPAAKIHSGGRATLKKMKDTGTKRIIRTILAAEAQPFDMGRVIAIVAVMELHAPEVLALTWGDYSLYKMRLDSLDSTELVRRVYSKIRRQLDKEREETYRHGKR